MVLESSYSSKVLFIKLIYLYVQAGIQEKKEISSGDVQEQGKSRLYKINFKKKTKSMGNSNDCSDNSQDNQEFQSIKTTYRSAKQGYPFQNVDIQAVTLQEKYLKWLTEMTNYLKVLSTKLKLSASQINQRFWLPLQKDFVSNQNFCKANKGRAVLTFQGGFCNLSQQVINRSFSNNPFSVSQLWRLLCFLSQSALLFRNHLPNFEINSNKIMIDNYLTCIKFLTPYTQFQPFIPIRTEPFVSHQKLLRTHRKINSSLQIQKKNDDFVVGMLLAECLLLQSCSDIYQLGIDGKKHLNQQTLSKLYQKILKISYYPIKLKLVVIGLIQFSEDQRTTLYEISELLKPHKHKIQGFQTFHLRKTEFSNALGRKLTLLQSLIEKAKVQASQQIFHKGLATTSHHVIKQVKVVHPRIKSPYQSKEPLFPIDFPSNHTHSLNFSLSHIPKKERKDDDNESLVWSKSELKSNRQHSASKSPRLRQTAKEQQEKKEFRNPTLSQVCAKFDEYNKENQQQQPAVQDLFEPFKKESNPKDGINQGALQISQKSRLKKTQTFTQEISIQDKAPEHNEIKIQRTFSLTIKSDAENENTDKRTEQFDDLLNRQQQQNKPKQLFSLTERLQTKKIQSIRYELKPKIPLAKKPIQKKQQNSKSKDIPAAPVSLQRLKSNEDSLSEVVQYKSYLYQSPQFELDSNLSPISYKYEGNSKNVEQKNTQKKGQSKLQSLQYQSPIRKKELTLQNYQSPEKNGEKNAQVKEFKHTDSIINGLTNLISSKKLDISEPLKASLTPAVVPVQSKVAQYLKGFSKFSPQLIAQLNLRSSYPQDERLKIKARQSLSTNSLIMNQTRELFPLTQYPLSSQQQAQL